MNAQPATIFLFDIDSVLIEPRGYRAAVRATLQYFTHPLNLPDTMLPNEDVLSLFEAYRITSEWDMIPISLAALLNELYASNPGLPEFENLSALADRRFINIPGVIDYNTPTKIIGSALKVGEYPVQTVLRLMQPARGEENNNLPYPYLSGQPILSQLMENTRNIHHSQTTRIFQHFALGNEIYEQTYGIRAEFNCPSLLTQNDKVLLSPQSVSRLLQLSSNTHISMAAYTMRPSLPPREISIPISDYAPEAEMALELLGLQNCPLIGYGRVHYLASLVNMGPEAFLKPSPIQALAAILAAISWRELASLHTAFALSKGIDSGNNREFSYLLKFTPTPLSIHVFEDSPGGIEAARAAAAMLTRLGIHTTLNAWGIATQSDKVFALERIGARVFPHIELALASALALVETTS